jgi:hypothetical protein
MDLFRFLNFVFYKAVALHDTYTPQKVIWPEKGVYAKALALFEKKKM